mmetsp:Transcript_94983/g.252230  ORF Transcript_94983/g.252230 Transcript_94983/m.252230 type:complete len:335 (+) Transcript_94983:1312-2316(+)
MTSSASALRIVLALPISKSSVMAMDFTTTKYCCKSAKNFLRPMPPTSMCLHNNLACSGWILKLAMDSRCLQKTSDEIRSSPDCSKEAKSSSGLRPLVCTSSRKAIATWEYFPSTMVWQDFRVPSMVFAHFRSTAPAFPSIFASSFLASSIGPLVALGSLPSCSLMAALAAATASLTWACSFSACSKTERGVAKASSSGPCSAVSGSAASSTAFRLASIPSTFKTASARMASASFFSRASMCAFFSACSFFAKSALASMTFFLSVSKPVVAAVARARSFAISVLASTRGPLPLAFANSASLTFRKFETPLMLLRASAIALSIVPPKVENGVMASK